MSDFDWQTDDEIDWSADAASKAAKPTTRPPRRRLWLILTLGSLLSAALAVILYFQTQRRLAEAEALVTAELLTSVNLVQEASQNEDGDLLNALLSGRDPDWADQVQALGDDNRLNGRPDFGLTLLPSANEPTITLSPDLLSAEVTRIQRYQTIWDEPLTLQQTAVYRQGELRWLLAPPTADFWGDINTLPGQRLTLVYPERDAELVATLLLAFENALTQVCETEALIRCPLGFTIRLTTNPQALVGEPWLTPANQLTLPAPTLFGLPSSPEDEALFVQSYVVRMLTAVFADATAYSCCEQQAIFQALLNTQLTRLGYLPPSYSDAQLQTLITETDLTAVFSQVSTIWAAAELTEEQTAFLYAVVQVAQQASPNSSLPAKMSQLAEHETPLVWLRQISPRFEAEWQQIRREAGNLPPAPLQDVALLCGEALHRFDVSSRTIEPMLLGIRRGRWPLWPLPNGVLIQGTLASTGQNQWQAAAFADWQTDIIFARDLEPLNDTRSYQATVDPSGRTLVVQITTRNPTTNRIVNQFGTLDIESCRDADCDLNLIVGEPIWSPSGDRMLVLQPEVTAVPRRIFFILDRIDPATFAQTLQTTGNELLNAFWVTEEIIGLVERIPSGQQIVLRNFVTGQEVNLLTSAEINLLLDEPIPSNQFQIEQIVVGGEDQQYLALNLNQRYVILHHRVRNLTTVLGEFEGDNPIFFPAAAVAPNGRFLAFLTPTELHIINLVTPERQVVSLTNFAQVEPLIDWSDDNEWLLLATDSNIVMHHLSSNETDYFPHERSFCLGSAWVEAD